MELIRGNVEHAPPYPPEANLPRSGSIVETFGRTMLKGVGIVRTKCGIARIPSATILLIVVNRAARRIRPSFVRLNVLLTSIGIGLLSSVVAVAQSGAQQAAAIIGPDGEIYGNANAQKLVQEARRFDPMFCPEEQRDRDKAAHLYEQAINAQPGAKINAVIADRIAQLYAFYADPKKKVVPIRDKASQWWARCLESTNPKQLLWAQAQMGLTCVAADGQSALAACDKILKMDASQIELDEWKAWSAGDSSKNKALQERERERLRKRVAAIQVRAVQKKTRVEKQIKLAEKQKAVKKVSHQQPEVASWTIMKSLLVAVWVMLVAVFVARRIVRHQNLLHHQ